MRKVFHGERTTGEARALLPPLCLVTTGTSLDWGDLFKEQNRGIT